MFQNIGFTELLLIAIVALVIFGPQKLPEIGRVLGRTIRDFKKATNELLNDEPKAQIAPTKPVAPDPITPVAVASSVVSEEAPVAEIKSSPEDSASPEVESEPLSSPDEVKPVVSFVSHKNKSSKVVHITGTPVESVEAISKPFEASVSQEESDVLSATPAHVSAPTPKSAQQSGGTSSSRRLPD